MKNILCKRINNKLFTVVHYLGFIIMLYYPYVTRILERHAERTCTSEQDNEPCPGRIAEAALYSFLLVLMCYLIKNVVGYILAIGFMKCSFAMISDSPLFDFVEINQTTRLSKEIITTGLEYFEIFTKIGQGIRLFLLIIFMWALYLAIKRYLNEPKQKKMEPVNPELEMERRNQ